MDSKTETWNATFSKLYLIPTGAPGDIRDFLHDGPGSSSAATGAGAGVWAHATVLEQQQSWLGWPYLRFQN
jgi:hypothetical protein